MAAIARRSIQSACFILCAVLALSRGVTQSKPGGSLSGKLTDSFSAPLAGITVTLRNEATGAETRATTSRNGSYRLSGLESGEYSLEADSPQLGRGRVDGIIVAAGHEAHVQVAVELSLPQRPLIETSLRDVDPVAPVVDTTLPAEQLQQLPLTGRHWQDFALDTPAASASPETQSETALRGAGQSLPQVTIDGTSRTLAFGAAGAGTSSQSEAGQPAIGSEWAQGRGTGMSSPAIGQSAIREVQIAAGNAEVEADRAAAGAMRIETRSGANQLHGQAFLFDRQNSWGARNPFTQWVQQTEPATELTTPTFTPIAYTPPDRELTFGAGAGGRIRRDKLFWFAALDAYRRNDPGLATVHNPTEFFLQPTNDEMQVLSARLGGSANPVVAGLAAYSQMLGTLDNLLGPAPRTASQSVGFARIDWRAAERHRISIESIGALWDSPGGGLTRVSETYGNHSFGVSHATESLALARWEAFLTPNLLATTQASWGRDVLASRPGPPSPFEQSFLAGNAWGQLPQIVVDSRYGFTIGNPARFGRGSYPDERLSELQESVDYVHHSVLIKSGFQLLHNIDATSMLRNQTGTYHYSTVENFASDALVFAAFGLRDALDPDNQHNCDQTGTVWRDSAGNLRGLGNLPCYAYYTQTMGPSDWKFGTNDWAGFSTMQWQPSHLFVVSLGMRWEREQLPPMIPALINPDLPLTAHLPSLGNNWGPRASLAVGGSEGHWPVVRLGAGTYYARTENSTVETALTQTGSQNGDLSFFLRPTDDLPNYPGGAPPFPYVLAGEPLTEVKPAAAEFAQTFRNPEVHQGVAAIEETLPGHVRVTASALVSLGRRLPIAVDTNFDPKVNPGTITYAVIDPTGNGPIKTAQITVPFYAAWPSATSPTGFGGRLNPNYQQIVALEDRANSTYEAAVLRVDRFGSRGLSLHAHYTYAHAMDWNPMETTLTASSSLFDPAGFNLEYGTSNLDVRQSAAMIAVLESPWKAHGSPRSWTAQLANGWTLSGIGHYLSGLPYTMRTAGSIPEEFIAQSGEAIVGLGPGMNGSGGDNRVYGVGRNTFRYPPTWKADLRFAKGFDMGQMRRLEFLAESFNLFNHQNVTELETTGYSIEPGTLSGTLPTLNFLTGLKPGTTAFGQPLNINATNFYRERQIQLGLRMRF
jgi:hypothetical protein